MTIKPNGQDKPNPRKKPRKHSNNKSTKKESNTLKDDYIPFNQKSKTKFKNKKNNNRQAKENNWENTDDSDKNRQNKRRRHNSKSKKNDAFNQSPHFNDHSQPRSNQQNTKPKQVHHPWITAPQEFQSLLTSHDYLTEELNQLVNFISPSKKELLTRSWVIHKITRILEAAIPNSKCHAFGSFTTQLLLPSSDIDLVLLTDPNMTKKQFGQLLEKIRSLLREQQMLKTALLLPNARIPLLKFCELKTKYNIDICLNTTTGIESSKYTVKYLTEYPQLRWLIMLVKLLIDRLGLNDPSTGGIGGYALLLMGLSLIQLNDFGTLNLKDLFVKFLHHYGTVFNYELYGIDFSIPGHYFSKRTSHLRLQFNDPHKYRQSFIIIDPNQDNNIVSKATRKYSQIQNYFKLYYFQLMSKLDEINWKLNNEKGDNSTIKIYSVLSKWIEFDFKELNHRKIIEKLDFSHDTYFNQSVSQIEQGQDFMIQDLNELEVDQSYETPPTNYENDKIKQFEFVVSDSEDEEDILQAQTQAKQILNILSNPSIKAPKPKPEPNDATLKTKRKNEFWKSKGVKRSAEVIEVSSD